LLASFTPNSPTHLATILITVALIAALCVAGRALARTPEKERRLRLAWVVFVVLVQGFTQIWTNTAARFDPQRSLPLHICDIVPWVGVVALLSSSHLARSLAYFWGIGLGIWAFIMPILSAGPATLDFWLFWLGHAQIMATAAYIIVVLDFRPTGKSLGVSILATLVYSMAMLPLDLALDADYGYVGKRSAAAPLGPWPGRVLSLIIGKIVVFAVLYAPWWLRRRRSLV